MKKTKDGINQQKMEKKNPNHLKNDWLTFCLEKSISNKNNLNEQSDSI